MDNELDRARRGLMNYLVIEISGEGRSRPHSDGIKHVARLEAAARLAGRQEREAEVLQSKADMWREAASIANQVSGAGSIVGYCVDRAIAFERERDRLRAELNKEEKETGR